MREPWTTIVSVDDLAHALGFRGGTLDKRILVLDVRHNLKDPAWGPKAYAEGHVPHAQFAHVDGDLSAKPSPHTGRHPLPDVDAFVEWCSALGIDETMQVVAYDDFGGAPGSSSGAAGSGGGGAPWASRAWWLLRYYGHRNVAVLDGGLPAWRAAGYPLSIEVHPTTRRAFKGRPGHMPTVTTWDITTRTPRCLVDARGPTRYRGEEEPIDPVAGHIPGARNVPFAENTDKDGRFLPAEALRARYLALLAGLPPRDAAFYCGSGVTAPHDILAMEIAGLPGAALYPGSYSEWIRNPMRAVRTGGEP